jgi:hypothetical protein
MLPDDIIKLLNLQFTFDIENHPETDKMHQIRRRIRNYAYKVQAGNLDDVSSEFIEYFESKPDFIKWDHFGKIWDVDKNDPTVIVRRLVSVDQEWDNVLRRTLPELPADQVKIQPS